MAHPHRCIGLCTLGFHRGQWLLIGSVRIPNGRYKALSESLASAVREKAQWTILRVTWSMTTTMYYQLRPTHM